MVTSLDPPVNSVPEDGGVTTAKLADDAVTDPKIATHESTKITGLPIQTKSLDMGGFKVTNATLLGLVSIIPPEPTISSNFGNLYLDSNNSNRLSIKRNGASVDLEASVANAVLNNQANTYTGGGLQNFGGSSLDNVTDITITNDILMSNNGKIQWAGTDLRRIINDTFGFIFGVEAGDSVLFQYGITGEYEFDEQEADWKGNSLTNVGALDVIGTALTNSIRARSGEIATGIVGKQMVMSFNGSALFTHSIATRHNAGSQTNNAIDFYLWDQTVDADGVIGTKRVMTIEATGRVGILTDDPEEALDVIGNIKLSNFRTRAVNRAIPTIVDDVIGIGEFDFSDGAGSLWISVTAEATGLSISKEYLVPVQFDQTSNVWQTLIPISSTGVFGTQDFAIDIKVGNAIDKTNLRLRRTMGSISATANILIKQEGVDTDTFTPSTNTNSVIAPTSFFGSTVLTQVNGKVGIDTLTPLEPLDVIGDIKFNNFRSRAMTRTIPEGDENTVQIGEFDFTGGSGSIWLSVSVGSGDFTVSKQYILPIQKDQTGNVWAKLLPISSTGKFFNDDFDVDIKIGDLTEKANLRIRRTGGTIIAIANILIKQEGIDTDTFTPSTVTSSESVPSEFFLSTSLTQVDGRTGFGVTNPTASFHVVSVDSDTIPTTRIESSGINSGISDMHVGNRSPEGIVFGEGGAQYIRSSGLTSRSYENLDAAADTNWFTRSVLPENIVEINTSAQFEELASGGIITVSSNLTLKMNITVLTSSRFVIEAGNSLHITGRGAAGVGFIYIGTGTFFSGAGTLNVGDNATLISGSTGQLIDLILTGNDLVNFQNVLLVGWTELGSVTGGSFLLRFVTMVSVGDGFTLTNNVAVSIFNIAVLGIHHTGPLFIYNTNNPISAFVADTMIVDQSFGTSIFDFSTDIDINTISVLTNISPSEGNVYKTSQAGDANILSIADSSPATGTITQMADNGAGGATIFSTTTYFDGEIIAISGTVTYNGIYQVFNVVAGVSFDVSTTFTSNEAIGSVNSERIDITLTSNSIFAGDHLRIVGTNFYNGFFTALSSGGSVVTINGDFVQTETGTINVNISLDQTDFRLDVSNSKLTPDSMSIGSMSVTTPGAGFAPATGGLGDFNFEGNANAGEAMERWRLRNPNSGEMQYIGKEGFSGKITCYFNIDATTSKDYNIGFAKNGADLDQQSGFINIPKATLISFTIGISVVEGDIIKPRIEVDSGSQDIAVPMAAIIIE